MTSSINDPSGLINQLPVSIELPQEPKRFIETMTILYKRIAQTVNTKEGGLFSEQEFISNQQYNLDDPSSFKNVYRKVFDLVELNGGNIPADGVPHPFPHNITGLSKPTHIYGGAINTRPAGLGGPMMMPIPFPSNLINFTIEVWLDATKINIVVGSCQWDLSYAVVVCEYLKI